MQSEAGLREFYRYWFGETHTPSHFFGHVAFHLNNAWTVVSDFLNSFCVFLCSCAFLGWGWLNLRRSLLNRDRFFSLDLQQGPLLEGSSFTLFHIKIIGVSKRPLVLQLQVVSCFLLQVELDSEIYVVGRVGDRRLLLLQNCQLISSKNLCLPVAF